MIYVQDNIEEICQLLQAGKVILFPTDTVWGIGCDATSEEGIHKLFRIKENVPSEPLTVLVDGIVMLRKYVEEIHPRIETLLTLHERPLTIVYPQTKNLPDILMEGSFAVGMRIVRDPFCSELITSLGNPLVALGASQTDAPAPGHFGEVSSEIIRAVDYVVKHRQEDRNPGEPSVIATYDDDGQLEFIRS